MIQIGDIFTRELYSIYLARPGQTRGLPDHVDLDFRDYNLEPYGQGYPKNEHHFKVQEHYTKVLPELCKLLRVGLNFADFNRISDSELGQDVSFYVPVSGDRYEIEHGTGEIIRGDRVGALYQSVRWEISSTTKYHKLFQGAHTCTLVKNLNNPGGRRLLISCDSHMIPIIPILCHYYGEVVTVDARMCLPKKNWFIEVFDQTVLCYSESSSATKISRDNLRF